MFAPLLNDLFQMIDSFIDSLIHWFDFELTQWLIDSIIGWLIDLYLLTDSLIHWLIKVRSTSIWSVLPPPIFLFMNDGPDFQHKVRPSLVRYFIITSPTSPITLLPPLYPLGFMYFPKDIFPRVTSQVTISQLATSLMCDFLRGNFPKVRLGLLRCGMRHWGAESCG